MFARLMPPSLRNTLRLTLLSLLLVPACSRNIGPPPEAIQVEALYRVNIDSATSVTPDKNQVLYVGARMGRSGPPSIVRRIENPQIPGQFDLTEDHKMGMGMPMNGPMVIFARLDGDGDASTSDASDLVAESETAVAPGNDVTVNLVLQAVQDIATEQYAIEIIGDKLPSQGVMYVLMREQGGSIPIAAKKFDLPETLPVTVALSKADFMRPVDKKALQTLEVIIKVDQDQNPMSDQPGDLEGIAPLDMLKTKVVLKAIEVTGQ